LHCDYRANPKAHEQPNYLGSNEPMVNASNKSVSFLRRDLRDDRCYRHASGKREGQSHSYENNFHESPFPKPSIDIAIEAISS